MPLPEGWAAFASPDGSLAIGPRGRVVMRVDKTNDAEPAPPHSDALFAQIQQTAREAGEQAALIDARASDDAALVVFALGPRTGGDAGTGRTAFLGAKRIGKTLFLCASTPQANSDEVKAAVSACEALSLHP
jgi:hypothetical protein